MTIQSQVRAPRALVVINGAASLPISFEIDNNVTLHADTFYVVMPLAQQPTALIAEFEYWAMLDPLSTRIELLAGFPPNPQSYSKSDLNSWLLGVIDEVKISPVGNKVEIWGRDLTALFIDTKTAEKFQNQTSSQIAATLAARHGLQTQITATTTQVGTYYANDHTSLQDERTEWQLLTYLAQQEGFVVYTQGNTLVFGPAGDKLVYPLNVVQPTGDDPNWYADAIRFDLTRHLTIARDLIVTVRSWGWKPKKLVVATARKTRVKSAVSSGPATNEPPTTYIFNIHNLTPDAAQQKANELLLSISLHEMLLTAEWPGDTTLTAQSVIRLQGCGGFDQDYFPFSVKRTFEMPQDAESESGGFTMTAEAKNISPDSTVQE